jgi:cysteinyl-tRNA synthetase
MRRIMSDYLHYNVIYQINTTDIDDKIILRARQNVLLERLDKDSSVDVERMTELAQEAFEEARAKITHKKASVEMSLKNATDSRARKESDDILKQLELKTSNLEKIASNIKRAISSSRAEILESAKSVLAEYLDCRHGATVTEREVFVKHARHYEREFLQDMEALGIRPPDVLTRVTEYIDPIVAFIQKIIDRGLAYASPTGSVYLSLDKLAQAGHYYRKLSPAASATSADEMAEGEGALASSEVAEKRNANDFALWKASKAGEPAWDSPWGPGRPGWHIEVCLLENAWRWGLRCIIMYRRF